MWPQFVTRPVHGKLISDLESRCFRPGLYANLEVSDRVESAENTPTRKHTRNTTTALISTTKKVANSKTPGW